MAAAVVLVRAPVLVLVLVGWAIYILILRLFREGEVVVGAAVAGVQLGGGMEMIERRGGDA